MRPQKALGMGWISILLVLFLCFAACTQDVMGSAQAAYSPTVLSNIQAGQQVPEYGDRGGCAAASHGIVMPVQSMDLLQESEHILPFSAQEPGLRRLNATASPAIRSMMYIRPLSELASRTGGHAPP